MAYPDDKLKYMGSEKPRVTKLSVMWRAQSTNAHIRCVYGKTMASAIRNYRKTRDAYLESELERVLHFENVLRPEFIAKFGAPYLVQQFLNGNAHG